MDINKLIFFIKEELSRDSIPIEIIQNSFVKTVVFQKGDGIQNSQSITINERCILIVDIVKYSTRKMIEQLLLYETLNMLFNNTSKHLSELPLNPKWNIWEVYKSAGDGGQFIFGKDVNPISIRDAIMFSVYLMKNIIEYNKNLPSDALNHFEVRMALSYGEVFLTEDLNKNKDLIGDAFNLAARLASIKEATAKSILISDKVYHLLQLNKELFFHNFDKTQIISGELSDFIVGINPNQNNYLYIVRKGNFETKDRTIEAYNISGKINGVDIIMNN